MSDPTKPAKPLDEDAAVASPVGDAGSAKIAAARESDEERWRRTKSNLKTIVGAVLLAFFIRIVLFEAFEIDGPSMEPTLLNSDRVVVAKFPFGLFLPFTNQAVLSWGMPEPGNVVIVKSPYDDIDIVKRVIGVPGDRIEIRDDVIWRNGEPIHRRVVGPCREEESSEDPTDCEWIEEGIGEQRWRTSHSLLSVPESYSPMLVPPGHIFVMGDHRDRSNDSRNPRVGMIPIERVKGRALAIYWSNETRIRWDRVFSAIP
ncbi:MAG: signal peptidase I [Myxococcota bacterium]|nr:signal peptidase I [Myxococcota bacterium]